MQRGKHGYFLEQTTLCSGFLAGEYSGPSIVLTARESFQRAGHWFTLPLTFASRWFVTLQLKGLSRVRRQQQDRRCVCAGSGFASSLRPGCRDIDWRTALAFTAWAGQSVLKRTKETTPSCYAQTFLYRNTPEITPPPGYAEG